MPDPMPSRVTAARARRRVTVLDRVPSRWRWTGVGLLLLALTCCWSLATPLMSSPDEPSHVLRAAGVARGQVSLPMEDEADVVAPGRASLVELPTDYVAAAALPNCFAFQPDQSAECQQTLPPADGTAVTKTFAGQYPPLYYALVGWPSLLLPAHAGITAMRLASAAVTAALLTWGLFRTTRVPGNRGGLWGAAVAVTPMCLFLGATVNPAGFEISAAFAFWTACLAIVLDRRPVPTSALVQAVVTGGLLVSSRSTGPAWALAIAVVALVAAPAGRWRAVLRHPRTWWFAGATAAVCAAALGWLVLHPSVVTTHDAFPQLADRKVALLAVLGMGSQYLHNMIGDFGWLDAPAPEVTVVVWYAMTGALLLAALSARRAARLRLALLLAALGTAAAPIVLQVPTAADTGLIWQGRYALPVAVGVPLLAGFVAGRTRAASEGDLLRRTARGTLPVLLIGHVAAFYWASRRYAEGLDGDLITLHPDWSSPLSYLPGTALYGVIATALAACAWGYLHPGPAGAEPGGLTGDEQVATATPPAS